MSSLTSWFHQLVVGTHAQPTWTTHDANVALVETLSTPAPKRPALPTEIILQILSHPSRWILATSASHDSPYVNGATDAETPFLVTPPLCHPASLVRNIIFTFRSKDQGWSSFPEDRGTFRNSWTWFDAGLRRLSGSGLSNAGLPIVEVDTARCFLQCNRHAHREFQTYRIELDRGHQLVRGLVEGDKVVLWACQKFPGWTNTVEAAGIEVWALDELLAYG